MGRLSVQQQPGFGKSPRQPAKARKKAAPPVKVVYISNPMRVTTSAAKFRSIVQRLTGRDSNVAEMDFYPDAASTLHEVNEYDGDGGVELSACPPDPPSAGSALRSLCGGAESGLDLYASTLSDMFDDAFDPPQMLESTFPVMYEPQHRWILQTL